MLKESCDDFETAMLHLYNTTLKSSAPTPQTWRRAIVHRKSQERRPRASCQVRSICTIPMFYKLHSRLLYNSWEHRHWHPTKHLTMESSGSLNHTYGNVLTKGNSACLGKHIRFRRTKEFLASTACSGNRTGGHHHSTTTVSLPCGHSTH